MTSATTTALAVKTALRGILVNALLAVIKILTGVVGHSYALIADGIESLNDILSSTVVLVTLKFSALPPDENHPYGHGKAEQLGGLFCALSLLGAGVLIAVHSIGNLFERHHSPEWFTLPVLLLVIVTKVILSRYVLQKGEVTDSTALKGDAWHHRADAITSGAAFVGITASLIGGDGYEWADDVAALVGCTVIGYNGFSLLRTALHENMDGAPPEALLDEVRQVAAAVPEVLLVEKLRMKKIGLGYFMDIHIQVDPRMSVADGHRVAHAVKDKLLREVAQVNDVVTHLEPFDGPLPDAEAKGK